MKLSKATLGCAIGGWNFVTDPFVKTFQAASTFKEFVAQDMASEKEMNQKCDQSTENKKRIYQAYNSTVPELLKVPLPSDQELASRSCAFIKADFIGKRGQLQRTLEKNLSPKAFQTATSTRPKAEQEYLDWYRKGLGEVDPDLTLMNMAREALHKLDIRYECYNTVRASALVCEALALELTGAWMARKPLYELAGIQNLKTRSLKYRYKNEEKGDSLALVGDQVKYLTVQERKAYQVSIKKGKIYDADGKLFDTKDAKTIFAGSEGNGRAMFVMDRHGQIYISKYQKRGEFHHSSLVGGEKVAAAGEIEIVGGKITKITNRSGHYEPTPKMMEQFQKRLKDAGVDTSQIEVTIRNASEWKRYTARKKSDPK